MAYPLQKQCRPEGRRYSKSASGEDVFDFVEERGVAFDGAVFDFDDAVQLLEERLLFSRELGRNDDAHVDVEVAFAAVGIGQAFAFAAEKSAGLRAFGNGELFVFAADGGNENFGAESGLRNGDGDVAIEIGAAALEVGMVLHFEENVEVAGNAAVGSLLTFAGDAEAHAVVDAGRNGNFDGAGVFDAALAAAFGAALLDDFAGAVAVRASARNGEESLLIMHLATPFAMLADFHARAGLCAGAVAGRAIFHARNFQFGFHASGRVFERELQVVAHVGATLGTRMSTTATALAAAEDILEAEHLAENVLEFLEDRPEFAGVEDLIIEAGVAVTVVSGALLRIGKNAVGFAGFAKMMLGDGFVFRVAVGMPLHGGFAISTLDLVAGGVASDAENFVIITLGCRRHAGSVPPGSGCGIRCGIMARGIRGDANHSGAQNFAVKDVAGLEFFEDSVVGLVGSFHAFDSVMEIGIEALAFAFDFLQALLRKHVEHLLANQLEAGAKFVVRGVAMRGNGAVEAVENRKEMFHENFGAAMALLMALALDAFAVIVKIGLKAKQRVFQVGFFGGELFEFVADDFFDGRALADHLVFGFAIGPSSARL
jgi:hypothetical protein